MIGKVAALPDDENQPVEINADRSEFFLEDGAQTVIYYGTAEAPAEFVQGSLIVSGMELTIVRRQGDVERIVATGKPARFQQQPAIDQGIIYANGNSISFSGDIVRIEDQGELIQDGIIWSGCLIEWNLDTQSGQSSSDNCQQRTQTIIPAEAK